VILEAAEKNLMVTFRRLPYEIERAAKAIEASDMPDEYAQMLRSGTG
jgi:hypothetical protein